mmetsp:Transcript_22967/g.60662  ORF Transcript_22967/g.60662 Transcript_22967/m.60662 type:complete len:217 (+) Transcript_22967:3996-4646(+)
MSNSEVLPAPDGPISAVTPPPLSQPFRHPATPVTELRIRFDRCGSPGRSAVLTSEFESPPAGRRERFISSRPASSASCWAIRGDTGAGADAEVAGTQSVKFFHASIGPARVALATPPSPRPSSATPPPRCSNESMACGSVSFCSWPSPASSYSYSRLIEGWCLDVTSISSASLAGTPRSARERFSVAQSSSDVVFLNSTHAPTKHALASARPAICA